MNFDKPQTKSSFVRIIKNTLKNLMVNIFVRLKIDRTKEVRRYDEFG